MKRTRLGWSNLLLATLAPTQSTLSTKLLSVKFSCQLVAVESLACIFLHAVLRECHRGQSCPPLSSSFLLLLAVAIQPLGECHICHLLFAILYEYVFILFGQNQLGDGAWTAEAEAVTGTAMGRAQARGRGMRYRVKHVHTKYCAGMWHAACGTDNGNGNSNGSGWR